MIKGYEAGFDILNESMKVVGKHPRLLVPFFLSAAIQAWIILYFKFFFDWEGCSILLAILIFFAIIFANTFLLSFSCSMLLELIKQIENGEKVSIKRAFFVALTRDAAKLIFLDIIWAIAWFVLTIINVLLLKLRRAVEGEGGSFSAENSAKALAGYNDVSILNLFFAALAKGIRMVVFLIIPAMVWDDLPLGRAIKKGLVIFKTNLSEFFTGYLVSWIIISALMIPPFLAFYFSDKFSIILPDIAWFGVSLYIVIVASFSMYLEQMFSALLYLWHIKWEQIAGEMQREGKPIPAMNEILPPNILEEVRDINY